MINRRWIFWLSIGLLFFVFLFLIRGVLLPFVLGILIAYMLDPLADRFERLRMGRGVATLLVIALFFTSIGLLSIVIIPVIAHQLSGLILSLPDYAVSFEQQYASHINRLLGDLPAEQMKSVKSAVTNFSGVMIGFVGDFISGMLRSGMAFINLLSLILITPVVAFYLLRDWDLMVTRLDDWLPRSHLQIIREQLAIIDATLAGFLRGQINVCLILSAFYAILLSLVGLKFAIVIGIATGLLVIFPYVGWLLGAAVGLGVALFQFESSEPVMVIAAIFISGMALEGYVITPKLVGEKVGLHPVWIIFGMLAGGALFGFVGVLIAVPMTAIIGVAIRFALTQYLRSGYYRGEALIATTPKR